MERLTEYRDGIATPVPELYLMAVQENIPQENWNSYVIKKLSEKLARLEDLKEQGRLLELHCDIGQRVYEVYRFLDAGAWEIDVHKIRLEDMNKIGKTVFLTREEAEEALKRMEGCEMNLGEATAIFRNIHNSERTDEEKKLAIRTVLDMDTHNGITKQEFINALDWLINHPTAYDVDKVVEQLEEYRGEIGDTVTDIIDVVKAGVVNE